MLLDCQVLTATTEHRRRIARPTRALPPPDEQPRPSLSDSPRPRKAAPLSARQPSGCCASPTAIASPPMRRATRTASTLLAAACLLTAHPSLADPPTPSRGRRRAAAQPRPTPPATTPPTVCWEAAQRCLVRRRSERETNACISRAFVQCRPPDDPGLREMLRRLNPRLPYAPNGIAVPPDPDAVPLPPDHSQRVSAGEAPEA
jgi:hypothetical protein